jgi:Na+/proline symporter
MHSRNGLIFGIISSIGNFAAVFVDESYFTAAIAARPSASWKGYLLAGAICFTIPFAIATSVGLASRAVGLPLSEQEAGQGLVAPAVAVHFMGATGAYLVALLVLLSVTSAFMLACVAF